MNLMQMAQLSIFSLLAALDWTTLQWWVDVILKVSIGLGAVIFVHELGHFLVAKACGVKCEKFMIGFDIGGYKLSNKWGETEYGIGILPLGGYVKMLGQDDDPAHIAEQMEKSQVDAKSSNAVPVTGPNGETYYVDRRSYLAKSVPQRMAIISAGVVMNIIFAFIFAVIAYGMGVPYLPSIVSETVPGSPAWAAGLEPGDEIVQFGDTVNPTFIQLKGGVTLGDLEHGIPCLVRRAADGQVVPMMLKPRQEGGRLATIGIGGPQSLTLLRALPVVDDSPAARAKLVVPETGYKGKTSLQGGDEIIRVGDVPVSDYREFSAELARQSDQPLRITVRRTTERSAGAKETPPAESEFEELTFEVPPQPLQQFGLNLTIGPITAVRANSPAAAAKVTAGDVIEKLDGQGPGEGGDLAKSWDAVTLPDYLRRAANEGHQVQMTLRRPTGDELSLEVSAQLTPVVPDMINMVFPPRSPGTPLAANEIGIAYRIENKLAAVAPETPAATELAPGDEIVAATVIFANDDKTGETPEPFPIELGQVHPNWPRLLDVVQFVPAGTEVEFDVRRGKETELRKVKLKPVPAEGVFIAARGFLFEPIERVRKATTLAEQVRYGWDETAESLTMVFRFLKKLGTQVPLSALGGPVTIAKAAGYSAAEGMSSLLIFLTMLSANLAVINFLPIPLLDGGHMVFLAYEGIRGRPAKEKLVVALHTAGFVFIVSLMLYVLALDLELIPRNL